MKRLQDFDKEFITDLFLESDSISTVNRLAVAVADIVNQNNDNISILNQILHNEVEYDADFGESAFSSPRHTAPSSRVKRFYENTIFNYSEDEYEDRFHMKKATVQGLIEYLRSIMTTSSTVPLDKKVHVFLWLLTTDSSYNDIGVLFDLHKSSVNYIMNEIATVLTQIQNEFIRWLSPEEQHVTRIKVHSRLKLPNCVGFLDACRLKVGSKFNKKHKPQIMMLQAVCDDSLLFTNIHIGEVGKTKKHKVYKDSLLSKELKDLVEYENHILGDNEYKLKMNLITPFSSEELLTSEEMKFNETHWKARAYIGRAFELLKERFRKLHHLEICKEDTIKSLVQAACVLHNFVILQEGLQSNDLVKEEVISSEDGVTIDTNIVTTALEKRQFLCNYVNYIDSND